MSDHDSETISGALTPVDVDVVTTTSLEALQGDGQRKILDIVDKLRRQGLGGIIELPQLVVCGDQSSGKSSVLEAITEIPFPRAENTCTRFATEIILRRAPISSITVKINPDKDRAPNEQQKLRAFHKTISDFTDLPTIINDAGAAMGLEALEKGLNTFAKDVLTVEISGPQRPQLTLVDLPGLIHNSKNEDDVKVITELVLQYMNNPRTIILAVISAKNDFVNQVIIKHCRKIDPNGRRTLGIITKPDTLKDGTPNQDRWLDLAQNKDHYFELGWHIVKNRSEDDIDKPFIWRNQAERSFFSKGKYADLPDSSKGIDRLRTRLSILLFEHLKKELPHLKAELSEKVDEVTKGLAVLGVKRGTVQEQRTFLTDVGMIISKTLDAALSGQYDQPFFGSVDMKAPVDSLHNIRRFRAVIQHLNLSFGNRMHLSGHTYAIPRRSSGNTNAEELVDRDPAPWSDDENAQPGKDGKRRWSSAFGENSTQNVKKPSNEFETTPMTRREGVDWVVRILKRSRGKELPGSFNPLVISQLFWEQSKKWNEMTLQHVDKVSQSCKSFITVVLQAFAPDDIRPRLSDLCFDGLDKSIKAAQEELAKIISDKSRHPMTYNHYFTSTIQDQRKSLYADAMLKVVDSVVETRTHFGAPSPPFIDPGRLKSGVKSHLEQNMDRFSAEEALDYQQAFYKDELKYFIDCVSKQVVERHLVDPLPSTMLAPRIIAGMTDEQIAHFAAEAPEVARNREYLEERKTVLERGLKIFRETMGGFN
ncbi:hypothetical protein P154DRAFT_32097 [Amniculicola lignicola CBS 123094]|uniref:Dynamin family protein n=1 Tax=Amniculicola lignicola CBS 123094 TaxID=1392246 RepID=A0A6A5W2G9_9PLEO|nr:hypothetical protein P154DRAFT_32097 [Amniculicola lignicola CBS 123094]